MKRKTSDLADLALDIAVAKCRGLTLYKDELLDGVVMQGWHASGHYTDTNQWIRLEELCYSSDWAQGGPIIEAERISVSIGHDGVWLAYSMQNYEDRKEFIQGGPTPLISAMRCYVASKLGDEVDIPTSCSD